MGNVYTEEFIKQNEVCEQSWSTPKFPDAWRLRNQEARELRKEGWMVKVGKTSFSDLGYGDLYWLEATRPRKEQGDSESSSSNQENTGLARK